MCSLIYCRPGKAGSLQGHAGHHDSEGWTRMLHSSTRQPAPVQYTYICVYVRGRKTGKERKRERERERERKGRKERKKERKKKRERKWEQQKGGRCLQQRRGYENREPSIAPHTYPTIHFYIATLEIYLLRMFSFTLSAPHDTRQSPSRTTLVTASLWIASSPMHKGCTKPPSRRLRRLRKRESQEEENKKKSRNHKRERENMWEWEKNEQSLLLHTHLYTIHVMPLVPIDGADPTHSIRFAFTVLGKDTFERGGRG